MVLFKWFGKSFWCFKTCFLSCSDVFFFALNLIGIVPFVCKCFLQFLLAYFLVGNFVIIKGLHVNVSFIDWCFGNFVYYDVTIWRHSEHVVIIVLRRDTALCSGPSRISGAIPVKGKGLISSTKHPVRVCNPTSLPFSWHCFKAAATRIWPLTSVWCHGWEWLRLLSFPIYMVCTWTNVF